MEIAGYPYLENVCSNVLAFFMDPEESHGLGSLVLDALASAGDISAGNEGVGGNVSVEREVATDNGRIDILITSDDSAILIENKICARTNNPFDDYAAYLDCIANGRAKHKFLLTLYPTDEGTESDFVNLTYREFVKHIRSKLGNHIASADTRCLTMFLDFLNTLENLHRGTHMNPEFIKLLAERQEDAENLFYELTQFKLELRKKARELRNLINVEEYNNVEQRLERERTSLYDDLVHDISVSEDLVVSLDTSIFAEGWEIWIWPREGTYLQLRNLLQELDIPFQEYESDGGFCHRDNFKHAYEENLEGIRLLTQDLIDKLATYRGA